MDHARRHPTLNAALLRRYVASHRPQGHEAVTLLRLPHLSVLLEDEDLQTSGGGPDGEAQTANTTASHDDIVDRGQSLR